MRDGLVHLLCAAVCLWIIGCPNHKLATDDSHVDAGVDAAADNDASADAAEPTDEAWTVIGTLQPDEECIASADSSFLLKGRFDVSGGDRCSSPYAASLLVHSGLLAPEPVDVPPVGPGIGLIQATWAQVTLFGLDDQPIDFGDLPHPFNVVTNATVPLATAQGPGVGVALIETIPTAYRVHLMALAMTDATISAEIVVHGVTLGGVEVVTAPYRFPIELCMGCLNVCRSEVTDDEIDELTDGVCVDNAGADGRFCIDTGC